MTQIDLPLGRKSGLVEAGRVLGKIDDIAFVGFNERDVVRHPLVREIVRAYERYADRNLAQGTPGFKRPDEQVEVD